jgi:hypothetical protein
MCSAVFFNSYVTLFGTTAMEGDKMLAGMMFGLAESSSAIISGVVCKYMSDFKAFNMFMLIAFTAQLVYYWLCEGVTGSIASLIAIYCIMLGIGSCINIIYLMIELRVTADKLGSSIVVVITSAMVCSSLASYVAFAQMPVPFIAALSLSIISFTGNQFLPPPLTTKTKGIA